MPLVLHEKVITKPKVMYIFSCVIFEKFYSFVFYNQVCDPFWVNFWEGCDVSVYICILCLWTSSSSIICWKDYLCFILMNSPKVILLHALIYLWHLLLHFVLHLLQIIWPSLNGFIFRLVVPFHCSLVYSFKITIKK